MEKQNPPTPAAPMFPVPSTTAGLEKMFEQLVDQGEEFAKTFTEDDAKLLMSFLSMTPDQRKEITPQLNELIEHKDDKGPIEWVIDHPWKTLSIAAGIAMLGYVGYQYLWADGTQGVEIDPVTSQPVTGTDIPDAQHDLLH